MNILIKDLEYLIALKKFNSFHKAALHCNVSQPTISGQIKKVEDILGIKIVERNSRKVVFTNSGLAIVNQAKNIVREVQLLTELSTKLSTEMSGPLYIGVIPTIAPYIIPNLIAKFKKIYPLLELKFIEGFTNNLLDMLQNGSLDFIIISHIKAADPFINLKLIDEELLLLVNTNNNLAKKDSISIGKLENKDTKILVLNNLNCFYDDVKKICNTYNIVENKNISSTSLETIKNVVQNNLGISIVPKLSVLNMENYKNIKTIKITDNFTRQLEFVYRPGSPLQDRYKKCHVIVKELLEELHLLK